MWKETASMLWYLSELVLVCLVIPVNPHFITCGCLQRVFWVFVKQLLKDKTCWCDSSSASHSVHGTQVSRKSDMFRLSVRMIWCDGNAILNILATSWVMILVLWTLRTHFLSVLLLMDFLNIWQLLQRSHQFWVGIPFEKLTFFAFSPL
jgi:hypothetical protein